MSANHSQALAPYGIRSPWHPASLGRVPRKRYGQRLAEEGSMQVKLFDVAHADSLAQSARWGGSRTRLAHPEFGPPGTITVQTLNGVVYLDGESDDGLDRADVPSIVRRVAGVKKVVNGTYVDNN
jgi:hypothetical protein